jgi:ATP-binding cassette subfamily B protein
MNAPSQAIGAPRDETDEEEIAARALLATLKPVAAIPEQPFAFLRFLVLSHAKGLALGLIACALCAGLLDAAVPALFGYVVTLAGAAAAAKDAALVLPGFALLVATWLGSVLVLRLYELIDSIMSPRLRALAQSYLFGYLLGHSPRYFQDNFAGKLGQKIKQAGVACLPLTNIVFLEGGYLVALLSVGGILLFRLNPAYAGFFVAWAVLHLSVSALLSRRCLGLSLALSEEITSSTGRFIDIIANADIVRAFATAFAERRRMSVFLAREQKASTQLRRFLMLMRGVQALGGILFVGVMAGLALSDTVNGTLSVGGFTMVFVLCNTIAAHVRNLSNRMLEFFEQLGILKEALQLVGERHDIVDAADAQPLRVTAGAVRFDAVSFAFADGMRVFDGLSIAIAAGEKVALVGPSGAGKSTLVRLLRRQYEPQAGRILIDGQDIAHVTWDSLNEAVAEVPQAPGIFHRPVRDNIRYARPMAPEAEVIQAAKKAHAHEFIARRARGYDTIVGEQGIKLSGGERQRVAIARALVKEARILVLDEATSSLDSESEHLIQDALLAVMAGRTVIAIAHRLSTIAGMDRIIYLQRGRILEEGSHKALLAKGGAYARLWARQAGGFLTD